MSSHSSSSKQQVTLPLLAGDSKQRASGSGGDDESGSKAEGGAAIAGDGRKPKANEKISDTVEPEVFHDAQAPPDEYEHEHEEEDEEEAGDPPYPEPAVEQELLPPPDFKPFFTLIEDTESGEHHHPSVHYLFSDDDPEVLTSATLAAIDQQNTVALQEEVEERVVLLDMAADGKTITSASSLSPRWQALKTSIGQAPSWGDGSQAAERGSMLKISGQEVRETIQRQPAERSPDMDTLIQTFNERLHGLEQIIGAAGAVQASQEESVQKASSNV